MNGRPSFLSTFVEGYFPIRPQMWGIQSFLLQEAQNVRGYYAARALQSTSQLSNYTESDRVQRLQQTLSDWKHQKKQPNGAGACPAAGFILHRLSTGKDDNVMTSLHLTWGMKRTWRKRSLLHEGAHLMQKVLVNHEILWFLSVVCTNDPMKLNLALNASSSLSHQIHLHMFDAKYSLVKIKRSLLFHFSISFPLSRSALLVLSGRPWLLIVEHEQTQKKTPTNKPAAVEASVHRTLQLFSVDRKKPPQMLKQHLWTSLCGFSPWDLFW